MTLSSRNQPMPPSDAKKDKPDNLQEMTVHPTHSDDELKCKIVELIEYYLSDENVLKDRFLLKHIRRNKEGYVNIKLMTSYRKVKSLVKDWKIVASSLKQSTTLELNSEENRVRRKVPLPAYEECSRSKSVVAYNFPFDKPTVDKVGSLFSSCGDIFAIQILRPGCNVSTDVRKLFSNNPEMSTETCALIEFDDESSIRTAMDFEDVKVLPLIDISGRNRPHKKRGSKKTTVKHTKPQNFKDNEKRRSSSVSSGYLSSSPSFSYPDLKCSSQTFRETASSTVEYQNYRETNKYRPTQKLSGRPTCILRLPKGPDGTKGFKDLHRASLSRK